MADPTAELRWRIDALATSLDDIEEADPKLMRYELRALNRKLDSLLKAIIAVGVGVVSSAIVFAFTVFALLGGPS